MKNKGIIIWLAFGCLLVLTMIVVGGITRLTHSGLSMVQWHLFMGSIPPMSQEAWQEVFGLYQQTPEFKLRNYHFSLAEFKSIFWWEYFHRMIGRFVGLVFILPFLYFIITKQISGSFLKKLLVVLALGAFQGFMGWYMVKSGLVKNPEVSHYRLAAHLIIAVLLLGITFWLMLDKIYLKQTIQKTSTTQKIVGSLILVLLVQIVYGAFVSGLKAGYIYNTFPMMGAQWVADSIPFAFEKSGFISLVENHATVQFIHRCLAYVIVILVTATWYKSRTIPLIGVQSTALKMLLIATIIQVTLGISTLLMAVPISLGVLHQFGAIMLLMSTLFLYFHLRHEV